MISSRTPEGQPNWCAVCRRRFRLSPSSPGKDAPCPRCGTLAWFAPGPGGSASPGRSAPGHTRPAVPGRRPAAPGDFTLDDFRRQFEAVARVGMQYMIARMPGVSEMIPEGEDPEAAVRRVRGKIDSMTAEERADPGLIGRSRRRRIAAGVGVDPHEVGQFLRQFAQVRELMRQMAEMSLWQRAKLVLGLGKWF